MYESSVLMLCFHKFYILYFLFHFHSRPEIDLHTRYAAACYIFRCILSFTLYRQAENPQTARSTVYPSFSLSGTISVNMVITEITSPRERELQDNFPAKSIERYSPAVARSCIVFPFSAAFYSGLALLYNFIIYCHIC